MRRQKWSVWVLLTLVTVLLLAPGAVAARAIRIDCTGMESPPSVLDEGVWTFPGGNIHVRGRVSQYEEASSVCPQLAGINTTTMNANWNANFVGPMWGTALAETGYGGGGAWQGHWQGALSADGSCTYQAVLHGVSGSVTGMKAMLTADCNTGAWTATILDPHGG
jgi:hypothetical protein